MSTSAVNCRFRRQERPGNVHMQWAGHRGETIVRRRSVPSPRGFINLDGFSDSSDSSSTTSVETSSSETSSDWSSCTPPKEPGPRRRRVRRSSVPRRRSHAEAREPAACTFKPTITKSGRAQRKGMREGVFSWEHVLYTDELSKRADALRERQLLFRRREREQLRELAECTFTPRILSDSHHQRQRCKSDVFDTLYNDATQRQKALTKEAIRSDCEQQKQARLAADVAHHCQRARMGDLTNTYAGPAAGWKAPVADQPPARRSTVEAGTRLHAEAHARLGRRARREQDEERKVKQLSSRSPNPAASRRQAKAAPARSPTPPPPADRQPPNPLRPPGPCEPQQQLQQLQQLQQQEQQQEGGPCQDHPQGLPLGVVGEAATAGAADAAAARALEPGERRASPAGASPQPAPAGEAGCRPAAADSSEDKGSGTAGSRATPPPTGEAGRRPAAADSLEDEGPGAAGSRAEENPNTPPPAGKAGRQPAAADSPEDKDPGAEENPNPNPKPPVRRRAKVFARLYEHARAAPPELARLSRDPEVNDELFEAQCPFRPATTPLPAFVAEARAAAARRRALLLRRLAARREHERARAASRRGGGRAESFRRANEFAVFSDQGGASPNPQRPAVFSKQQRQGSKPKPLDLQHPVMFSEQQQQDSKPKPPNRQRPAVFSEQQQQGSKPKLLDLQYPGMFPEQQQQGSKPVPLDLQCPVVFSEQHGSKRLAVRRERRRAEGPEFRRGNDFAIFSDEHPVVFSKQQGSTPKPLDRQCPVVFSEQHQQSSKLKPLDLQYPVVFSEQQGSEPEPADLQYPVVSLEQQGRKPKPLDPQCPVVFSEQHGGNRLAVRRERSRSARRAAARGQGLELFRRGDFVIFSDQLAGTPSSIQRPVVFSEQGGGKPKPSKRSMERYNLNAGPIPSGATGHQLCRSVSGETDDANGRRSDATEGECHARSTAASPYSAGVHEPSVAQGCASASPYHGKERSRLGVKVCSLPISSGDEGRLIATVEQIGRSNARPEAASRGQVVQERASVSQCRRHANNDESGHVQARILRCRSEPVATGNRVLRQEEESSPTACTREATPVPVAAKRETRDRSIESGVQAPQAAAQQNDGGSHWLPDSWGGQKFKGREDPADVEFDVIANDPFSHTRRHLGFDTQDPAQVKSQSRRSYADGTRDDGGAIHVSAILDEPVAQTRVCNMDHPAQEGCVEDNDVDDDEGDVSAIICEPFAHKTRPLGLHGDIPASQNEHVCVEDEDNDEGNASAIVYEPFAHNTRSLGFNDDLPAQVDSQSEHGYIEGEDVDEEEAEESPFETDELKASQGSHRHERHSSQGRSEGQEERKTSAVDGEETRCVPQHFITQKRRALERVDPTQLGSATESETTAEPDAETDGDGPAEAGVRAVGRSPGSNHAWLRAEGARSDGRSGPGRAAQKGSRGECEANADASSELGSPCATAALFHHPAPSERSHSGPPAGFLGSFPFAHHSRPFEQYVSVSPPDRLAGEHAPGAAGIRRSSSGGTCGSDDNLRLHS
ncbi:hypothetical protein DIPPA_23336 [Diplonema papillatum]|nr:hypothetical protein DIPPA_23336 [Diplonema papillatum]